MAPIMQEVSRTYIIAHIKWIIELYIARASGESDTASNYRLCTKVWTSSATLEWDDWIGVATSIGQMIPEKSSKFSTVSLRAQELNEYQPLDGGNVFGQIWRREDLRIGGKHIGIGMNGRRSLRRWRSIWASRANYEQKILDGYWL
jgi:hypothetical protein